MVLQISGTLFVDSILVKKPSSRIWAKNICDKNRDQQNYHTEIYMHSHLRNNPHCEIPTNLLTKVIDSMCIHGRFGDTCKWKRSGRFPTSG